MLYIKVNFIDSKFKEFVTIIISDNLFSKTISIEKYLLLIYKCL